MTEHKVSKGSRVGASFKRVSGEAMSTVEAVEAVEAAAEGVDEAEKAAAEAVEAVREGS